MKKAKRIMIILAVSIMVFSQFIHAETTGAEEKAQRYMKEYEESWINYLEKRISRGGKFELKKSKSKLEDSIYDITDKKIRDEMFINLEEMEKYMEDEEQIVKESEDPFLGFTMVAIIIIFLLGCVFMVIGLDIIGASLLFVVMSLFMIVLFPRIF